MPSAITTSRNTPLVLHNSTLEMASGPTPATQSGNGASKSGDIEMGGVDAHPVQPTPAGEETRKQLRDKEDKEERERKETYKKLMDVLDSVEDRNLMNYSTFICLSIETFLILGLTATMACSLTVERIKHRRFLRLRIWQWVMMTMVLLTGLSVIRFITFCVFRVVRQVWRVHRDLGYFLREIKTCVDVTLWFCLILFAWYVWFRPRLKHVHGDLSVILAHQATRFLIALCLGSVLWVAKSSLFLWLEADLHYRQLCDRITRTVIQLHGIQILQNVGEWRFLTKSRDKKKILEIMRKKMRQESVSDEDEKEVKSIWPKGKNIWEDLLMVKREDVPIVILRRLCEEFSDQLRMKPLRVNKEMIKDDKKLMDTAKKLFREIKGVDQPNLGDIVRADLESGRYGLATREVDMIFEKFRKLQRGDENNDVDRISRDQFCSWVTHAYRNCWGLESTLRSSEQIIIKLNRLMIAFVLILALIIWLLLSDIVDSGQIALLFSPLLAAKFMFSESSKNMFDGLVFALAMHPFKAGDRVIIQEMQLLVTEMNILTTTFFKYETGEELIYPNSELAIMQIINLELVPDERDRLEFTVPYDTPLEDIKDLEVQIQKLLDDTEDAWNTKVVKKEMTKEEIKMNVHFKYVVSNLTADAKAVRRSEMLGMIMNLLKKMTPAEENAAPLTCKPYIFDVNLEENVTLKKINDIMKEVIERFIVKNVIESSLRNQHRNYKSKAVLKNIKGKNIQMAIYVWESLENTEHQQPDLELYSDVDLQKLRQQLKEAEIPVKEVKPSTVCSYI